MYFLLKGPDKLKKQTVGKLQKSFRQRWFDQFCIREEHLDTLSMREESRLSQMQKFRHWRRDFHTCKHFPSRVNFYSTLTLREKRRRPGGWLTVLPDWRQTAEVKGADRLFQASHLRCLITYIRRVSLTFIQISASLRPKNCVCLVSPDD